MKDLVKKILKEDRESDVMLKLMINSKINPLFYLDIQEKLIDDYGYDWVDDIDKIIETHAKYFKIIYNMDFNPYNFLTAFFSHMTENRNYLSSDHKIYYEKYGISYFVKDEENKMFYFDFENVWNRLHEFFSLSVDEIKKITKKWVNKELGLKGYNTYLYR